jgi:hypothetical protein
MIPMRITSYVPGLWLNLTYGSHSATSSMKALYSPSVRKLRPEKVFHVETFLGNMGFWALVSTLLSLRTLERSLAAKMETPA